ncbi:unnamed protein product [Closterium sp. NIES-64]|nr:unnamed protein product [Closterium sp. NIES-64]
MVYWALLTDLIAAISSTVTDASFFPRVFLKLLKAGWTCCTSPCRLYAKACKASAYPLPSMPNSSSSGGWFGDHTNESVRSHHASCSGAHLGGPPSDAAADAAANSSIADPPASEGVDWLVESQARMGPEGCLQTDIPLSQGEQQEQKRRQQLRWRKRLTATFRSRYTKSASAVETSRNATAGAGVGRKGSAVNGKGMDAADGVASPCSPDAVTPIVLVHGIFGFGHGKFGGISYFGGAEYRHDKVLVPDLGSLTSIHDRARDLFYYLKGGTVDYGVEHSAACGHDRFGKTYAQGKHPLWDAQHPIHLVAHSSGVQAARMLQHMLHNKEFEGYDDTSADWVASITSLSGALNGTTRVYIDGLSYFSLLEADHILFIISRQRAGVRFDVLYDSIFHRCRTDLTALSIIASADANAAPSGSLTAQTAAAVAAADGGWLGAEQGQVSGEGEEVQEGVGLALSEVGAKVNSGAGTTTSRSYRLVTSSSTPSFLPSNVASPRGKCEKAGGAVSGAGLGLDGGRAGGKCREISENGVVDGEEGSTESVLEWAPQYKWAVGENEVEEVEEGKEMGYYQYQEQEAQGARVDGCHECDRQQKALAAVVDLFGAPLTNVCVCSLRNGRGGSGSRSGSGMRSSMSLDFLGDMWSWNGGKDVSSGRTRKGKENTARIRKVSWWGGTGLQKHKQELLSLEGEEQDGGSTAVHCGAGGVTALDWGCMPPQHIE